MARRGGTLGGGPDALAVAALYVHASALGLSLGDRACLALARRLDVPAVSAEHIWADLDVGIEMKLVRPRLSGETAR